MSYVFHRCHFIKLNARDKDVLDVQIQLRISKYGSMLKLLPMYGSITMPFYSINNHDQCASTVFTINYLITSCVPSYCS